MRAQSWLLTLFACFAAAQLTACDDAPSTLDKMSAEAASASQQATLDAQRAAAQSAAAASVARAKADEQQKTAQQLQLYQHMTAAQRIAEVAKVCSAKELSCDHKDLALLQTATDDPAEAKRLEAVIASATRAESAAADHADAAATQSLREDFARKYDAQLLDQHMNPDGVEATGTSKTVLRVHGWFCGRQYLSDFSKGPIGAQARIVGFKRLECFDAAESGSIDL
jgi:hypothetical protein